MPELAEAIRTALAVYAGSKRTDLNVAPSKLTEAMAAEYVLGVARIPGRPMREDLPAYMCALLAAKIIAGCADNYDRSAVLRLLYAAAQQIRCRKFPEPGRLVPATDGDIEPWPARRQQPKPAYKRRQHSRSETER